MGIPLGCLPKDHIEQQIAAIDAYIAAQEFEAPPSEDNILNNKYLDSGYTSPSGYQLLEEHVFATALLANIIKHLRSNHFVPDYPILFEMLKLIFGISTPCNALTYGQDLPLQNSLNITHTPLLNMFNSILSKNQIKSNLFVSRLNADFAITDKLGSGAWGTVIRVRHNIDGKEYAIKKIRIKSAESGESQLREIRMLAGLQHENINRYHSAWLDFEIKGSVNNGTVLRENETSYPETEASNSGNNQNLINPNIFQEQDQSEPFVFQHQEPTNPIGFKDKEETESSVERNDDCESSIMSGFTHIGSQKPFVNKFALTRNHLAINTNNIIKNTLIRQHSFPFSNTPFWPKSYIPKSLETKVVAKIQPIEPELTCIMCIQLELCETNLGEWLFKRNNICRTIDRLTESDISIARDFDLQFFRGLNYLHSKGCLHRDIKPKNILLTNNCTVLKICDFGLSKYAISDLECESGINSISKHTCHVGTRRYASPEQVRGGNYTVQTDIFSSALVMLELFYPFTTDCEKEKYLHMVKEGKIPEELNSKFPFESSLIEQMVNLDWEKRPTSFKILTELLENRATEEDTRELIALFKLKLAEIEKNPRF